MATDKRTYPNNYFVWYNDDRRIAILCEDSSTDSTEKTIEKYDTYQGADVTGGLRISYHSKYETVEASSDNLSLDIGVDTGLHECILHYVRARLLEDSGELERAQYYRNLYEKKLKQYPTRKSGVRQLSVPRL